MSDILRANQCPKCGTPISADAPQGLCPKCILLDAARTTESAPHVQTRPEVPPLDRVAAAFPQLEILELVGQGGMGFVFKARQPHLDRLVALKLLTEKLAQDPRFAERFHREGRVLARLNHPNIVAVYDFGQAGGFFYLMMEFVDGVNLRQAMEAGRFSPAEALAIVPRICEALQYAHGQGVLHRDIKPANILLDARGQVKIADFGIAKLVGENQPDVTLTATGATLGTPHYMAPEQLEKPSEVDHRADIYSLGVVFYEMLTGELPIGRFAPPSSKTPVGTGVDEVVFRTLEKDRERRYQSAGEMKTQVEHLGSGGLTAPASPGAIQWSWRSIIGAGLVAFSLPFPLLILAALLSSHGRVGPGELALVVGNVSLFGMAGTLLGWFGLHEIRDSARKVRGLAFALFAALTWPLLILLIPTLALPAFVVVLVPEGPVSMLNLAGHLLFLLLPAGLITFGIWAVYATARWANREPVAQRRGVLKWIFTALLLALVGGALANWSRAAKPGRPEVLELRDASQAPAIPADLRVVGNQPGEVLARQWLRAPESANTTNAIRFTFTEIELRLENGELWLAIDYATDIRGNCEVVFQTRGGGLATRKKSMLVTPPDSPPVSRHRFQCQIPAGADRQAVADLADEFAKALVGKSFLVPAGEQRPLVRFPASTAGDISLAIGAILRDGPP